MRMRSERPEHARGAPDRRAGTGLEETNLAASGAASNGAATRDATTAATRGAANRSATKTTKTTKTTKNEQLTASGRHRILDVRRVILQLTSSQLATTAITGGLGWIYWAAAARLFPSAEVGFTAAAISALTLVGALSNMGAGTLLMGELRRQSEHRLMLLYTALLIVGTIGLGAGVAAAYIAPLFSADLGDVVADLPSATLFAIGISLTTVALVLDQALLGLLKGALQVTRNLIFAASKLVLLILVGLAWLPLRATLGDRTILATWVSGLALSMVVLPLVPLSHRTRRPDVIDGERGAAARPTQRAPRGARRLVRTSLSHYALNLGLQLPFFCLPLLVTALLSTTSTAYFYSTWIWGSFIFAIPLALAWSLYTVSAGNPATLAQRIRFTLPLAALVGVATNIVLFPAAQLILSLYGPQYAANGLWCLRLQGFAVFPLIVKDHFVNIRRAQQRTASAAWRTALGAGLEVLGAIVGTRLWGLTGVTLGWLGALVIEAGLAAPLVLNIWRGVSPAARLPVPTPLPQAWAPGAWLSLDAGLPVVNTRWATLAATTGLRRAPDESDGATGALGQYAWLDVVDAAAPEGSRRHYIQARSITIGRSKTCSLTIDDILVSRLQARLYVDEQERYVLQDMNSANGTLVNGRFITTWILADSDHISVGQTTLIFRLAGRAPSAAPPSP